MPLRGVALGVVLAWLLSLAGCDDPALDEGRSPALELAQPGIVIPLGVPSTDAVIRRDVAALAAGADADADAEPVAGGAAIRTPSDDGPQAIRARINTASAERAQQIRAQLLQLGLDPARIVIGDGRLEQLLLVRTDISAASCGTALRPTWNGDVANSLDSLGMCIQAQALAGMAVDPNDIAAPLHPDRADGSVSARAIHRWESVPVQAVSASPSADEAGGGAPGPTGVGSPQSAPAPDGNPLLSPVPLPVGPNIE